MGFTLLRVEPKAQSSEAWKRAEATGEKWVAALGQMSKSDRRLMIAAYFAGEPPGKDVHRLYRYSLLLNHFPGDLRETGTSSEAVQSLQNTPVVADPIFLRAAFVSLSLLGDTPLWKDLGLKLLRIFPNDVELKRAFVVNATRSSQTLDVALMGLKLLEEIPLSDPSRFGYHNSRANLSWRVYGFNKSKRHLEESIRSFKFVCASDRLKPPYAKVYGEYLAHLEQLHKAGKYQEP